MLLQAGLGAHMDITFVGCSDEVNRILSPDVMKSVRQLFPDLLAALPVLLYQGEHWVLLCCMRCRQPAQEHLLCPPLTAAGSPCGLHRHCDARGSPLTYLASKVSYDSCYSAGQYDVQDGPACSEAWISSLQWQDQEAFAKAKRVVWRLGGDEVPASWLLQGRHSIAPVAGYVKHHGPLTLVIVREAGHMVPHDQPLAARHMMEKWVQTALGGPDWLSGGHSSQEQ